MDKFDKFKVGEKIKCIDLGSNAYLELNRIYTVYKAHGHLVLLAELNRHNGNHAYPASLFVKVRTESDFQIGDNVVCIRSDYSHTQTEIERGKFYKIHEIDNFSGDLRFKSDGLLWDKNRFKLAVPYPHEEVIEDATINKPIKTSTFMNIIQTVKKLALKTTNPDESALREAGIHDECGNLTEEGMEVLTSVLEAAHTKELVDIANQVIAERKTK